MIKLGVTLSARLLYRFWTTGPRVRKEEYWIHRDKTLARRFKSHNGKDTCYLYITERRNRDDSASQTSHDFCVPTGSRVSRITLSRKIRKTRLFAIRCAVCITLSSANRKVHLASVQRSKSCSADQWVTILFIDESRLSIIIMAMKFWWSWQAPCCMVHIPPCLRM